MIISNMLKNWVAQMNWLDNEFNVELYEGDSELDRVCVVEFSYGDFHAQGLYDNDNPEYVYITTSSLCCAKQVEGTRAYRDAAYAIGEALRVAQETGICFYGLAIGTLDFLSQFEQIKWHFTLQNCGDFYTGGHDPYHFSSTTEKEYVHI